MISQRVTADLQGAGPRAVCSLWAVRTRDGMVTRTWGTRTDPASGRLPPPSQGAQERLVPALPCSAPRHLCRVPEDPPLGSRMEGLGGWPHAQTYCPGRSARLPQWAERQGGPSAPTDLLWDWSLHLSPGEEGGEVGDRGRELTGRTLPEPPARSVSDINECRRYPGRLCGHKCENTPGSYYCSCTMGFRLSSDGRSCEGEGRPWAGVGGRWACICSSSPSCLPPRRSPGRPAWERLTCTPTRIR